MDRLRSGRRNLLLSALFVFAGVRRWCGRVVGIHRVARANVVSTSEEKNVRACTIDFRSPADWQLELQDVQTRRRTGVQLELQLQQAQGVVPAEHTTCGLSRKAPHR